MTMITFTLRYRLPLLLALIVGGFIMMGAGCSSDPNVEGAKLDLTNKDYDRALNNLDLALQNNPDNVEALKLKGDVLLEKAGTLPDPAEHMAAIVDMNEAYNRALELTDDEALENQIIQQQKMAWYREYERGMAAFNKGSEDRANFETAAAYFENATDIQPDSAVTYINLAYALISSGRSADAIEPLEMAIEKGDDNPDTYNYLSDMYTSNGDLEKAMAFTEDAVQKFPTDENLRARLFNLYIQTDQVDRGLEVAMANVESNPDNPTYRYNYGSLLLQSENYDEAIEQLSKAAELDPESSNALYNLGAAFQNKAVAVNAGIADLESQMAGADVTDEQREEMQAQVDALMGERTELFQEAIPHLVKARQLLETAGEDATGVCQALFQAYAQTNMVDEAEEAADCAGIDLGSE